MRFKRPDRAEHGRKQSGEGMSFVPVDLMLSRVDRSGDSDYSLFVELLYAGEFIIKLTVAAFVASIEDDRGAHRYRLLHALVRADGIGEWASKLDEALTGPASQHLASSLIDDRRAFTERVGKDSWQYSIVKRLHDVLSSIYPDAQPMAERVSLRTWFPMFAEVRNKTRGHGAVTAANCAKLVPGLRESITQLAAYNPIFQRSWAYLHRNLSGKYNVVMLGGSGSDFKALTSTAAVQGEHYPDGVYIYAGRPRRVELVHGDLDASDFFLPNGAFNGKTYELHSLITDSRLTGDANRYLAVAGERPHSETEGKGELDLVENVFSNMPPVPAGYVRRPELESEVLQVLTNDRHPVVTLVGGGGIGKTSLTLSVLHQIAATDRYRVIVWFSARDIDLTLAGPKVVQPRILAERDIAEEYRTLIGYQPDKSTGQVPALSTMAEHMRSSPIGPTLFVFDNFETLRHPVDLFQWIDTNIRLPNKVVITSRFREFKADFPIEIFGMEREEAEDLISQTAAALNIQKLIGQRERDQIVEESGGHPYVIKIILGEIANTGAFGKPSKLIAGKEEILDALFDRTFASLSPMATRIFLTLSGWHSLVPELAIEATFLRAGRDGADPGKGVNELGRMSLVERTPAPDGTDFIGVPLAAAVYGAKKLQVSPHRQLIENDIRFLQDVGATTLTGVKEGLRPRVWALFRRIAKRIADGGTSLDEMRPVLEFVARHYYPAWLLLAEIQRECGGDAALQFSADYLRRFLEKEPTGEEAQGAWQQLITIYHATGDVVGGCGAFLRAAEISDPPLYQIASMAQWLNSEREIIDRMDVVERGALFKPLAKLLESHLREASSTDLSRLAWLHLHVGDQKRALEVAEIGLTRDPENRHCQSLVERLTA
jgi:hypothetical protein